MNVAAPPEQAFGTYRPGPNTILLRSLTRLGFARGKVTKTLLRRWLRLHGPLVDAVVSNVKYRLDLSNNTTDAKVLLSSNVYDGVELDALKRAAKGRVFVDIGANIGYYTLSLIAGGCGRVVAIEPNPPTLERLRFNVAINGFENRVRVIPEGVGPDGELDFYQTDGLGTASFVAPDSNTPSLKVRTRPLLAIMAAEGVTAIGGMKIDVEGFEDQVLVPFLEEAPPSLLPDCIVMEACHDGSWKIDLKQLLEAKSYRLMRRTRANLVFQRQT